MLSRFPPAAMNELFASSEAQALAEASEEGFAHEPCSSRRLLDLRYPHQGYHAAGRLVRPTSTDADKPRLKHAFDDAASAGLWPVRAQARTPRS